MRTVVVDAMAPGGPIAIPTVGLASAECAADEYVTGGGYRFGSSTSGVVPQLLVNAPVDVVSPFDPINGWSVLAVGAVGSSFTLIVYAVCAQNSVQPTG